MVRHMHHQIKVCFLLGSLNRGGTETLMLDICNNFKSEGFSLILAHRKKGYLENEFHKSGIPMFQLSEKRVEYLHLIQNLRALLIKQKVDIVHVHQPIDAILAKCAIRKLKIKIVLSHHGFIHNIISKFLIRAALSLVDLNIFVSQSCRIIYENYLGKSMKQKSAILYNGVDINRLTTARRTFQINNKILDNSTFKMGMVGSFHASTRDHLTVCKALGMLEKNFKDFVFVFAGGASPSGLKYMTNCMAECDGLGLSNKVIFTGTIDYVPSLLKQLDAYVYSTNYETFGIGLVEALILGLPSIINDHPTLLEITNNGQYALVYRTGNVTDLFNKISLLINDPETRLKLSSQSKLFSREKFSINDHILKLLDIYNHILAPSQNS